MERENMERFEVGVFALSGGPADISLHCDRCGKWAVHIDRPLTLAELVQRAGEHAEVCP